MTSRQHVGKLTFVGLSHCNFVVMCSYSTTSLHLTRQTRLCCLMGLCFRYPSKIKWKSRILFVFYENKILSPPTSHWFDWSRVGFGERGAEKRQRCQGIGLLANLWPDFFWSSTFRLSLQSEPQGQGEEGQALSGTQETWEWGFCAFIVVNLVLFMGTTFFVLEFKWHFESWPTWIILAPHPDPPWDCWIHLGLCLDSCNDVFQTHCLAAHSNDGQGLIGHFGTCQVLNAGMKVLMLMEGEIDLSWTWQQCHHAKLCQHDAWTFPDRGLF